MLSNEVGGEIRVVGNLSAGLIVGGANNNTLINSGHIVLLNRAYGIFIVGGSGNTAVNAAGGTINPSGLGSSAMEVLDSDSNTLRNEGTLNVSGAGAHGIYVVAGNANTLDNRGMLNITGARGNGLRADDGNSTLLNSGTILVGGSDAFGVYMQGTNNTLTNSGSIRATGNNADGVVSNTVAGTFTTTIENTSTGQIISDKRFAVRGVNGQETLINSGLVSSGAGTAIDLRAGNDTLILRTGSRIVGLADGGTGTDLVTLEGTGQATNDFQNFETLRMTGSDWRWSGNGIEVVSALNGATSTAQTTRTAFALAGGHVDAGAFEYRLYAADAGGAGESWYLRTTRLVPAPASPAAPGSPAAPPPPLMEDPSLGDPAPIAGIPGLVEVPAYRAEVPLLAALPMQMRQSNLAMVGNLHQRVGDEDLGTTTDVPGYGQRRAWARVITTDIDVKQAGTVSPSTDGRLNGVQGGTDLYANGAWRAGLYAAQLDGSLDARGFASGLADQAVGSNDVRNQYLGGYLTYANTTGLYADTVLQGGRHRYTVQPLHSAHFNGKASSWLARLGVRAKGEIGTGAGMLQPYARLNFYRTSGSDDMARFIGSADIVSNTDASWGEVAAGLTLTLNSAASFYGEAGRLFSVGGSDTTVRSDLQGSLGVRLRW